MSAEVEADASCSSCSNSPLSFKARTSCLSSSLEKFWYMADTSPRVEEAIGESDHTEKTVPSSHLIAQIQLYALKHMSLSHRVTQKHLQKKVYILCYEMLTFPQCVSPHIRTPECALGAHQPLPKTRETIRAAWTCRVGRTVTIDKSNQTNKKKSCITQNKSGKQKTQLASKCTQSAIL